jgi:hypothetical protein
MSGINYVGLLDVVKKERFPLDKAKIKFHKVNLTGLELVLYESGIGFSTYLNVEGYNSCIIDKSQSDNKEEALKEFRKISKAMKEGKYTLHIYGNGKIGLDVKY